MWVEGGKTLGIDWKPGTDTENQYTLPKSGVTSGIVFKYPLNLFELQQNDRKVRLGAGHWQRLGAAMTVRIIILLFCKLSYKDFNFEFPSLLATLTLAMQAA